MSICKVQLWFYFNKWATFPHTFQDPVESDLLPCLSVGFGVLLVCCLMVKLLGLGPDACEIGPLLMISKY